MNFLSKMKLLNTKILNHQFDEVKSILNGINPITEIETRILNHYHAMVDMQVGEFYLARTNLQRTINNYGENVNLLRDLAICQYQLQDMMGFRASVTVLEQRLIDLEGELSTESLTACELTLGKLLEEDARLSSSILFYERALRRSQSRSHKIRALVQKGRWIALYDPSRDLGPIYQELISTSTTDLTADLKIELEHSLMLIELKLVGSDHAWRRVENLIDKTSIIDQRLLIFDYIEGALDHDEGICAKALTIANSLNDLNSCEQFIKKLASGPIEPAHLIHELTLLATQLPWASYLRLICIAANNSSTPTIRQELQRKIQLIALALDEDSQNLWNKRLNQALLNPEIKIDFSNRQRSLFVSGKTVDLSKKKIALQLLSALLAKSTLTIDEAIDLLWQSSFSPEHYHRLRMSVHRLNVLINEATGVGKIVEIDSQHIKLRPEVKMRHSDEAFSLGFIGI